MANTVRGKRGSIGSLIFDQVEKIVGEEKITRLAAFQRISDETGRQPGTVSANYYRIARQRGITGRQGSGRGPGRPRGARNAGGSDLSAAIGQVTAAFATLQVTARRQEAELERLRRENAQFDEIRRLARRVS